MKALILAVVLLGGCALTPPDLKKPRNSIGYAASLVDGSAKALRSACGNVEPMGDCLPESAISTAERNRLAQQIVQSWEYVKLANDLSLKGESHESALIHTEWIINQAIEFMAARGVTVDG